MHLHKLLARNKGRGEFRAEASEDAATVYLYDAIVDTDEDAEFFGGVAPQSFIRALNDIKAPVIHLRINSPGGSVFAARAMEQAMREHPSKIVAHVDGYAASAASFLAMGADEIEIAPGGMFMIHKAWTVAFGNADDLINTADLLEKIDGSLVKTYAARTGTDAEQIAAWMAAETWLDAEEAVAAGFADRIAEAAPKARIEWDLSAYAKAPEIEQEPEPEKTYDLEAMKRRLEVASRI